MTFTSAALAAKYAAAARPLIPSRLRSALAAPGVGRIHRITLGSGSVAEAIEDCTRCPEIEWAEPNRTRSACLVPNDPYFATSGAWGQAYRDMWGLEKIQAAQAWDITTGSSAVVVAVIDTGIDFTHADMAANIWTNGDETPGDGVDNDGNGYIDDYRGWDFVNGDNNPSDDHGHGTHCAGTIAAATDNGQGISGVCWNARIMPLKFLGSTGSGTDADGAEAIVYAADNGARILSNSWGGGGVSRTLREALEYAHARGCVIVAAAGNNNGDTMDFSPACENTVISVAASDHDDAKSSFSNWGPKIDAAAPGGSGSEADGATRAGADILSLRAEGTDIFGDGVCIVGGNYYRARGTSMACPHAAGLAALVLSHNPLLSNEEVRQVLHRGADDVESAGWDKKTGFGRINALKSLQAGEVSVPYISFPHCGDKLSTAVDITGSAFGGAFSSYQLEYGAGDEPQNWTSISSSAVPVTNGALGRWDTIYAADGYYTLRLTVNGSAGETDRYLLSVTVKNTEITAPAEDHCMKAGAALAILGSSTGPSFQRYALDWGKSNAYYWPSAWKTDGISLEQGGLQPVVDGTLGSFDTSVVTEPGNYLLRLRTFSGAGVAMDCRNLIVDPGFRDGWPRPFERAAAGIGTEIVQWSPSVADIDGDGRAELFVDGLYDASRGGDSVYSFDVDGDPLPAFGQPDYDIRWVPSLADATNGGGCEVIGGKGPGAGYFSIFRHDKTVPAGWASTLATTPFTSAADLNADGHLEIAGALSNCVYVLDDRGSVLAGWPVYPGPVYEPPALGDINHDGTKEVVCAVAGANGATLLAVYDYLGRPLAGWPLQISDGLIHASPALCDIDGDQDLEIAAGGSAHVYVFHHGGQPAEGWPQAVASVVTSPSAGDMDGDGRCELAVACGDGKAYLFNWRGELMTGWPRSMYESFSGDAFSNAALADVDGDGAAEVVVAGSSLINNGTAYLTERCKIYAFRMNGQLVAGWPKVLGSSAGPLNTPALGDFDGDGLLEMAATAAGFPYSRLCVWELGSAASGAAMPWPMHHHDSARTASGPFLVALPTRTPTATPTASPTATRTPTRTPSPTPTAAARIVINQVCPFSSPGEYVELYNNESASVSLEGLTLNVYQNDYIFTASDVIPAHGFFLISDTAPVKGAAPDVLCTINISDNGLNSFAQLLDSSSNAIDTVGWAGSSLYEGTALGTLGTGNAWKRGADGIDTGNNAGDFLQVVPSPRNRFHNPPTITPTPTMTPTPTPWAFPRRINFQPADSALPGGFAADDGAEYGTRGYCYYGWGI